ncbi:MAG: histidine kinase [Pseudomonadota bacterium]
MKQMIMSWPLALCEPLARDATRNPAARKGDPLQFSNHLDGRLNKLLMNKAELFWALHCAGWAAYGILRWLNGLSFGRDATYAYPTIIATLAGFGLTLILRALYRWLWGRHPGLILGLSIPAITIMTMVFSAIEVWGHTQFFDRDWPLEGKDFFLGNALFDAYVLLSWSGLYFGINYYRQLRAQQNRLLAITAMAHQAQLQMLRYQLNPHFLFNTLNAISTLVLVKRNDTANVMLTRLSAFLRHTLANQPMQKVTLAQELHALELYLDIEKTRFADRLRLDFNVTDEAREATLPSLLLQPLVENAIKFAVAPMEAGGTLSLNAEISGNLLTILIADTGPGLRDYGHLPESHEGGVGLRNTSERLKQIYGNAHEFRLAPNTPSGLCIYISIPLETEVERAEPETDAAFEAAAIIAE